MAEDPYASIATPSADPYASIATPSGESGNAVQRFLDKSVTPPAGEKMDNSLEGIANQAYYGVPQGIEHVIAHPLDTLSGIGTTLSNLPAAAKQFGKQALSQPVLTLGQTLGATAAMQPVADLGMAAARTVPAAAGRAVLLGKTPEAAYESALKPSTTLPQSQRSAMVQTGLKNAIPISQGGVEKLGDLIDDLNSKIKDQIASDPTRPIDPNAVATRADMAKAKFANQVNAGGDLAAIEASKQQFLREQGAPTDAAGNSTGPAPAMNAADAQAMKQGTYQVLKGKYGEQGSASVEAQKALARGLKEEIADQFPEIGKLNADESRLLDFQPILERAVNRISNHQLIGIGTPVAGAAAKAVTGSSGVGAVAGVLKAVLDNPAVKSRLAIAISKGGQIPIGQAASRVNAYSSALAAGAGASTAGTPDQSATQ